MENLYLIHSAKGAVWKKHKYIKKIPSGNGYRYVYEGTGAPASKKAYDQAENDAKEKLRELLGSEGGYTVDDIDEDMLQYYLNLNNFDRPANDPSWQDAFGFEQDIRKLDRYEQPRRTGANGMPSKVANNLGRNQKYSRLRFS